MEWWNGGMVDNGMMECMRWWNNGKWRGGVMESSSIRTCFASYGLPSVVGVLNEAKTW